MSLCDYQFLLNQYISPGHLNVKDILLNVIKICHNVIKTLHLKKQFIMSTYLLLPNKFKKIGWFILIPSFIAGIILCITDYQAEWLHTKTFAVVNEEIFGKSQYFSLIETNITNTLVGVLFIVGAMLVSFSKEKTEDEYITNLRLQSLQWALLVNNLLLLFSFLFIYGTTFLSIMVYNMFTVVVIFIIRFNYILYKNTKFATDEK